MVRTYSADADRRKTEISLLPCFYHYFSIWYNMQIVFTLHPSFSPYQIGWTLHFHEVMICNTDMKQNTKPEPRIIFIGLADTHEISERKPCKKEHRLIEYNGQWKFVLYKPVWSVISITILTLTGLSYCIKHIKICRHGIRNLMKLWYAVSTDAINGCSSFWLSLHERFFMQLQLGMYSFL